MSPERMDRLRRTAAAYVAASLAFLPILLLLRGYEVWSLARTHPLAERSAGLIARGVLADVVFLLQLSAALLPLLLLAQRLPRAMGYAQRAVLAIVAMAGAALAQYYAVSSVPLGADLFGYDLAEVTDTARSVGGLGLAGVGVVVAFGVAAWLATGAATRLRLPRAAVAGFLLLAVASVPLAGVVGVRSSDYDGESAYFLVANKSAYFAVRTAGYLGDRFRPQSASAAITGFPLMHPADDADVLGPLLALGDAAPNLVFVVVEGLGSDFTGPDGYYRGFTPFIDSLATHSLHWENFLSTSGRTFGLLPGMMGSLPYGQSGFVELRERMPAHHSLMSVLKEQGYTTRYFVGSDAHFDYVDLFLERQGLDRLVDERDFGAGYVKAPADEGGFSWGYPDRELFRRGLEELETSAPSPRIDVFHTSATHEPFIPPDAPRWRAEFEHRLATLPIDEPRRKEYRRHSRVFESLLYADESVRFFLTEYAKRPDFANTIFLITGDHRLIPVPPRSRIDRYRVPFIVHSPLVKAPRRFRSVSSHLDVAPTFLAMLGRRYGMALPARAHWLGGAIDTATAFRSTRSIPLMRTKNEQDEYLDGDVFVSGGSAYRLGRGMTLEPTRGEAAERAFAKLERFQQVNRYVTSGDRIMPPAGGGDARLAAIREDTAFLALGLGELNSDELYFLARDKAIAHDFETARVICRHLLATSPNLHDVRTLLGRTYAWDDGYDEARPIFRDVIRRAPRYRDARLALIDLEIWDGRKDVALALADSALAVFPGDAELKARRARAAAP